MSDWQIVAFSIVTFLIGWWLARIDGPFRKPPPAKTNYVVVREGNIKKNLNEPPVTERPPAPRSQLPPLPTTIRLRGR